MLKKILFFLLILNSTVLAFEEGIRIAWDFKTLKKLYGRYSFYPRMIRLQNGRILCAFENWKMEDGELSASILVLYSDDDGHSWSEPVLVAKTENGVNPAVPDLTQLNTGYVLLAYNPRPPKNNVDPTKRFAIKTAISMDGGQHWLPWSDVYTGSYLFADGCWEPSPLQLPDGELQLYIANETPYPHSNEQEISMFRSYDYGYSWSDTVTVSFREGFRDGMPVPLLLQNGQGIVFSIEDNGWDGQFKPTIIWSSMEDNWRSGPVGGNSLRRWRALKAEYRISAGDVGAAPYIIQLPSGEVILSYQGTEGRHPNSNPEPNLVSMFTAIGDENAQNFTRKSQPFLIKTDRTAMWNSLFVKNQKIITAVTSTTNYSDDASSEIYMIDGYVLPEPEVHYVPEINLDGKLDEAEWSKADSLFIGAYSTTQYWLKLLWNDSALYIGGCSADSNFWADDQGNVFDDDGLTFYFDLRNLNTHQIRPGIFRLGVDISGEVKLDQGMENGGWEAEAAVNVKAGAVYRGTMNDMQQDSGFTFEIQIPWNQIGGKPRVGEGWGFSTELREDSNGGAIELIEHLSGNEALRPFTWLKTTLKDSLATLIVPQRGQESGPVNKLNIYPNPFNHSTQITYQLDRLSLIRLGIFDVSGKKVNTLVNQPCPAGVYQQTWDGTNRAGHEVASGIYYCLLDNGFQKVVRKLVLIR